MDQILRKVLKEKLKFGLKNKSPLNEDAVERVFRGTSLKEKEG